MVHKGRKEALGETSSKDNRTRVRGECEWGHWAEGWWEIMGREAGRRGGWERESDNWVCKNVFKSFQYHEGEMGCEGGLFTPLILSMKQCRPESLASSIEHCAYIVRIGCEGSFVPFHSLQKNFF